VAKKKKESKPVGFGYEQALKDIEKLYGKGAIMKMGDKPMDVDVVTTGSMKLDHELHIGGFPRGRVIEIFGPESSGKCLPADTRIGTPYGLLTIGEIFKMQGLKATCTNRTTASEFPLYNRNGEIEETTHFTHNNRKPTFTIRSFSGAHIRPTANQPQLVMSKNGFWVWKQVKQLEVGDYLVSDREIVRNHEFMMACNADEAYFAGLSLADGHFNRVRLGLTNDDPDIKEFIARVGSSIFGVEPKVYPSGSNTASINYHFNSVEAAAKFYESWGWEPCNSPDKIVGSRVRRLNDAALLEVLRGYFDCECFIHPSKMCIETVSASRELLDDVKLLLQLRFGIIGLLRDKHVAEYPNNNYWQLTMAGDAARKFIQVVGTRSSSRAKKHDELLRLHGDGGSTNHDSIPCLGGLLRDLYDSAETNRELNVLMDCYMAPSPRALVTYNRLELISEAFKEIGDPIILARLAEIRKRWYYYDRVESVTENEPEPTFDFAMEQTASLNANGFVTHNTTLALHTIAEVQKQGGIAAFIDAEQALDPSLAKGVGVNVEEMLISQPDYGEQALEIVDTLVRSGAIDIIVVDSVSALTPKAELAGDMGDSLPGLQARLMSQALRKLVANTRTTKTMVIFINQTRLKIGTGGFGNPETTSGGKALRFYSSVRIDVRILGGIKKGETRIGNRLKLRVVKNKLAPPFGLAEVDLIFGRGIDQLCETLDLALEFDLIEKSGNWHSYGGDRIGNGREATIQYLREHPDDVKSLRETIMDKLQDS